MGSVAIGSIAFACMFGGALLGVFLRRHLPEQHLNPDSRDVVKLGAGLIATMAALVLGLMVSSAKGSFDKVNDGLIGRAANFANLDRILDQYGPETNEAREQLRRALVARIERMKTGVGGISADESATEMETLGDMLRKLTPRDESQRILKGVVLQVYGEGMRLRWSLIQQARTSIPTSFWSYSYSGSRCCSECSPCSPPAMRR